MSLTEEHHLSISIYFIIRKPSSDDCQDQELKEMAVAMDMTDNDVDMEIRGLPNFSLGFDFLWEVVCANRESTQSSDSSKDKPVMSKETNENCSTKPSFASTSKENFTKIRQFSNQSTEKCYQRQSDLHSGNKAFVEHIPRPGSKTTTVAPLKVTNLNISNDRTVASGQRLSSNNSLTTQNKGFPHDSGQRSTVGTHAKLQVVTPSCRPSNLGTRPAISPLLAVRN